MTRFGPQADTGPLDESDASEPFLQSNSLDVDVYDAETQDSGSIHDAALGLDFGRPAPQPDPYATQDFASMSASMEVEDDEALIAQVRVTPPHERAAAPSPNFELGDEYGGMSVDEAILALAADPVPAPQHPVSGTAQPAPDADIQALRDAIRLQNHPEILRAHDVLTEAGLVDQLSPLEDLIVGRLLYTWKRHFEAAVVCKRARDKNKKGEHAARALYLQARLMGEHLDMRDEASKLFTKCVQRYPDSEFVAQAQSMLDYYAIVREREAREASEAKRAAGDNAA